MTDSKSGSEHVDSQGKGNPDTQQKPPENGSAGGEGTKTWLDGLSEGNRKLAETKGWKAPEDVDKIVTSYSELERKQGDALYVPKPDAPKEEFEKLYTKLGRPDSPDKYEFKRPEGLPADLPYSDDLAKAAKPWMHEAGLNPKQAQSVHDGFVKFASEQQQARLTALGKAVDDTHDILVKEWGPLDSEGFKQKQAMANRALAKLGLTDVLKGKEIILPDGALTDPQIAKAFAAVGEAMFKEDTIVENGGGQGGENPFKKDAKGGRSPSAISALIKSDPERAKRLAREAGERWEDWVPPNPQ